MAPMLISQWITRACSTLLSTRRTNGASPRLAFSCHPPRSRVRWPVARRRPPMCRRSSSYRTRFMDARKCRCLTLSNFSELAFGTRPRTILVGQGMDDQRCDGRCLAGWGVAAWGIRDKRRANRISARSGARLRVQAPRGTRVRGASARLVLLDSGTRHGHAIYLYFAFIARSGAPSLARVRGRAVQHVDTRNRGAA